MKVIIITVIAIGVALIATGLRASEDRTQSADVRAGGSWPIIIGVALILLALIVSFVLFLVNL